MEVVQTLAFATPRFLSWSFDARLLTPTACCTPAAVDFRSRPIPNSHSHARLAVGLWHKAIHSKGGPESLQLHALTAHCDLDRTSTSEEVAALVGNKYGAGKDFGVYATVKRSEALPILTQRSESVARISHKGPLLVVAAAADGGLGRDRRTDRRADRRTGCVVRRRSPAPFR